MGRTTLIDRREESDATEDIRAVNSKTARALYKKRTPIHPKIAEGRFRTLKWAAMGVLLAIYYLTPFLRWNRGVGAPDQAVMVDFEGRRFYFFALELWPQEIYLIVGLLVLGAVGIFLSSALWGRVWCGYACPQTVWTDLYIHIERWIEGDRNARLRLARAPFSVSKATKKVTKHTLWLIVASVTGGAWIFYFGDAPTLVRNIFSGQASPVVYMFVALLTFTTYALAGTMREQVCTYMCPWPRIQAAMADQHTLSVTYHPNRGEPRGAHKKDTAWEGRGDCIDCRQCVVVCPQGIDIRDGDQLECINCALCIDACDAIMEKVGRPRGLISYDSYDNVARRLRGETAKLRFIRPRTIVYAGTLVIVAGLMLAGLMARTTLGIDAMRDRNPPYVRLSDGGVRNGYVVRLLNKKRSERDLELRVPDLPGAVLTTFGRQAGTDGVLRITARADTVSTIRVYIATHTPPSGATRISFRLHDPATGETATRDAVFMAETKR